ncbi:hypothetical protein HIM_08384 [Hirsutella minnesotensis 3608]|uniref:Uncharacterized protein n=1 Tax=Hirsutella minnesotensis 3608 TaxID=1043627 RepID=A0A0F7ZYC7_9HYPO|nr:hypothetical protein HIM_08384 [Hirsutella minnesotensis 3608]
MDLGQNQGLRRPLMLLIKNKRLFGTWAAANTTFGMEAMSLLSFDQLVTQGAFRPLDLKTLFHKAPPAKFSIKEKRTLALKLGFSLMDYFDADFMTKGIYFLDFSGRGLDKESPYLGISSSKKPSAKIDPYCLKRGHPALLALAKLLLEMEYGQSSDLDISPESSQNRLAWMTLMEIVEGLEVERGDSYLQAIRGCLVVHHDISLALRSGDFQDRDADMVIRKALYEEIVYYLERAVDESVPRAVQKRQRSESPTRPNSSDGHRTFAIRCAESDPSTSGYKKQRVAEPQRDLPASMAELNGGESHVKGGLASCVNMKCRHGSCLEEVSLLNDGMRPLQRMPCDFIAPNRFNMSARRPCRREDFEVAIICALPLEYDAVSYLVDEWWDEKGNQYGKMQKDPNIYTAGRIGSCDVILVLLPRMGKISAASAAASMRSSYSNVKLALLVGVCGAATYSQDREILLGDVIISNTIVQYDFSRRYPDKFVTKNTVEDRLGRPTKLVLNLLAMLKTDREYDKLKERAAYFLYELQAKAAQKQRYGKYNYPGTAKDKLFESSYRHKHHAPASCLCCDCASDSDPVCNEALSLSCGDLGCDDRYLVARDRLQARTQLERDDGDVHRLATIHIGAVGSGDTVIKSAADRDRIAKEAGVLAFEMEGAGAWDEVPSVVIKGVCDYADSHKHKGWQDFAAAMAASTSKAILERYIQTGHPA